MSPAASGPAAWRTRRGALPGRGNRLRSEMATPKIPFPFPAYPGAGRGRGRMYPARAPRLPVTAYKTPVTIPLVRQAQSYVSGAGTAQVSLGPSGVGTKWYPQTAVFSTTTYVQSCFVAIYTGFVSQSTLMNGQLYAGSGDSAGLAIPFMTPGDLIVCEWVNGNPGDIAQVTITGTQDVLNA